MESTAVTVLTHHWSLQQESRFYVTSYVIGRVNPSKDYYSPTLEA